MYTIPPIALLSLVFTLPACLAAPRCPVKSSSSAIAIPSTSTDNSFPSPTDAGSAGVPSPTSGSANDAPAKPISMDSTFIYELDNSPVDSPSITSSSGITVDGDVYIVDMAGTTDDQIAKYKADGKTVICYFSAGTWEPTRDDKFAFEGSCVCSGGTLTDKACSSNDNKMKDWNEWWLDLHSDSCKANVQNVMAARIAAARGKGCDGVDPDNVDSYINTDEQLHGNTEQDQIDYLLWLSDTARANNLTIGLKNGGDLLKEETTRDSIVKAFDFSVIEECHAYGECAVYEAFLNASKPNFQIEYGSGISSCPSLKDGQHLLVYSEDTLDTSKITLAC